MYRHLKLLFSLRCLSVLSLLLSRPFFLCLLLFFLPFPYRSFRSFSFFFFFLPFLSLTSSSGTRLPTRQRDSERDGRRRWLSFSLWRRHGHKEERANFLLFFVCSREAFSSFPVSLASFCTFCFSPDSDRLSSLQPSNLFEDSPGSTQFVFRCVQPTIERQAENWRSPYACLGRPGGREGWCVCTGVHCVLL